MVIFLHVYFNIHYFFRLVFFHVYDIHISFFHLYTMFISTYYSFIGPNNNFKVRNRSFPFNTMHVPPRHYGRNGRARSLSRNGGGSVPNVSILTEYCKEEPFKNNIVLPYSFYTRDRHLKIFNRKFTSLLPSTSHFILERTIGTLV